jgi:hypothetical protein
MAQAEHACGHPVAAAHRFERNRSAAGPPLSTPRSTTCTSASSGATCPRHSCTRRCSSARSPCPATSGSAPAGEFRRRRVPEWGRRCGR